MYRLGAFALVLIIWTSAVLSGPVSDTDRRSGHPLQGAVLQVLPLTDRERLEHEALERLKEVAAMDFTVIPGSFDSSIVGSEAHVMFKVTLVNGDVMHVDAIFEREGMHWRFARVGTLCCGAH